MANDQVTIAIKWAENNIGKKNTYIGQCHLFVCHAYENAGISTANYKGSAISVYERHRSSVKGGTPPPGAMILYKIKSDPTVPHTALSVGGGMMIHNNTTSKTTSIVEKVHYQQGYLTYLGWVQLIADTPKCSVKIPSRPTGPSSGKVNTRYTFSTTSAKCSAGHNLEYSYGNGVICTNWGPAKQTFSWSRKGSYPVNVQARCSVNKAVISPYSSSLTIQIR